MRATQQRAAVRRSGRICLLGLLAALPHALSLVDSETTEHESAEPQGRKRLHCVLRESQSHEDIVLLPLLLEAAATRGSKQMHRGPGGTFTDIGAFDGFIGSQTYLLERCFGWRGALIEASPQNFRQLNATHRSKHTVKVHAAACNGTGSITVAGGGGTVAGIVSDFSNSFAKKWSKAHTDCGGMPCTSEVPCRPLPTIVAEAGFPHVNFLSLDVEGSEERVLQTVAWLHGFALESFPFDVVMVEADHRNRGKDERVKRMLLKWGLLQRPIAQSIGSYNELYIHPDIHDVRPDVTAIRKRWRVPAVNQKLKEMLSKAAASHMMSLKLQQTNHNLVIERLTQGLPREMELLIQEMENNSTAAA
jgi:FkbM family methyltransferase